MNQTGTLISQQFPAVVIQPTTVIVTGSAGALVGTPECNFVQAVHVDQNHWVKLPTLIARKEQ